MIRKLGEAGCAESAKVDVLLTTDDRLLKKTIN